MLSYTIMGTVYRNGVRVETFDLGLGRAFGSREDANQVVSAHVMRLVNWGGTVTFDSTCQEYKIVMPTATEYISVPLQVAELHTTNT